MEIIGQTLKHGRLGNHLKKYSFSLLFIDNLNIDRTVNAQ